MKRLTNAQIDFLKKEFGISQIDYSNKQMLQTIRLKGFDIETDECSDSYHNRNINLSDRGVIAESIIDDLYNIIYSS